MGHEAYIAQNNKDNGAYRRCGYTAWTFLFICLEVLCHKSVFRQGDLKFLPTAIQHVALLFKQCKIARTRIFTHNHDLNLTQTQYTCGNCCPISWWDNKVKGTGWRRIDRCEIFPTFICQFLCFAVLRSMTQPFALFSPDNFNCGVSTCSFGSVANTYFNDLVLHSMITT
jgi:hypothetical protein